MNFKKTLFTLVFIGFYLANYAQSFKVDPNLISTPLTDSIDFSLLNSRLGSRFTFSLLNEKQSMQTSSLGFDMDDQTGLLISLTVDKKLYCFRTTKLPRNASYLKNQQLRFGPTSMQLTGETPEGIKVNFTLISAFTPSKDLNDSVAIKTQIFPGFYMQVNVDNSSAANTNCKLQIGLAKTPVKSFNFMALEPTKPRNTDPKCVV